MEGYVLLDDDNYIIDLVVEGSIPQEEHLKITFPDGHEVLKRPLIYQVIDGELVRDNEKAKPTIYFTLDKDNFLTSVGSNPNNEDSTGFKVAEEHEVLSNPEVFKFEDGDLIRDEVREKKLIDVVEAHENKPTTEELIDIILGGGQY